MLDLGTVRPGSTIRIPFDTFAGSTGASVTMTNFVAGDIQVYKDGGTTQRASSAGFTATTDFDSSTGLHLLVIDLADNTTAGFWAAGSEYLVAVADVTVDSQTVRAWVARFRIGYPDAILDTTVATLSSQTSFTLTAGSADNSAYVGCPVVVHKISSAIQVANGFVSAYTGSTKTVTLAADPAIYTMAAGDNISLFLPSNAKALGGTIQTGVNLNTLISALPTAAGITAAVANELSTANDAVQASPSPTTTTFAGSASLSATDDIYNGCYILPTSGTLDGIRRRIADYTGSTRLFTVSPAWTSAPASGVTFRVIDGPDDHLDAAASDIQARLPAALVGGRMDSSVGAAAANTLTASALATDAVTEIVTAVLDAFATAADAVAASPSPTTTAFAGSSSLSSSDDFYNGSVLMFTSGTLDGLARKIADYTGTTRLLTVSPALPAAPTAADTFRILGRID